MTLPAPHKNWKIDELPVPLTKFVGSDEMLTQLWLRVAYDNVQTASPEASRRYVAELASKIEGDHDQFRGFEPGSGIAETWLRADLVKTPKKQPDTFIVARPVHLLATRLRNTRKEDDATASAIPYHWLAEHDPDALEWLRQWLTVEEIDVNSLGDLSTYALALLGSEEPEDVLLNKTRAGGGDFLCETRGRWYAEDVRSVLAYRHKLPRAVVIDHLRRITTLHIAIHLVELYTAVVEIYADPNVSCGCESGQRCAWLPELVADCGEDQRSPQAVLAELSWEEFESTLAQYVRVHLELKRLQEFSSDRLNKKQLEANSIRGLARAKAKASTRDLAEWSRGRMTSLELHDKAFASLRSEYEALGMSDFDQYVAMLANDGERRWFKYHRDLFDSVLGKNDRDGAMRQPLGGRRRRRISLSAPLLESLVLAAMVRHDVDGRPQTRSLRVDQLTSRLATRYGLLIATPPLAHQNDPEAVRAMIANHTRFRTRLRQAGLFVDQSDAFLTQMIKPRITL
jgi:hypothetical protein